MSPVLDKKTSIDLVKLLVFVVVTSLATAVLVVTIGNLELRRSRDYRAEFTDATGVNKGDDIRVAGVRVGTVEQGRDHRPHPRPGHLLRRRGHLGQRRHQRRHPLPQPRRPALHLAHPGGRRHPAAAGGHDHPGLPDAARPST